MPLRHDHVRTTEQLIREGLEPRRTRSRIPAFKSLPAELQAAVNAYDDARRTSYGRTNEPAMSEANKAAIAPMIAAACQAFIAANARSAA